MFSANCAVCHKKSTNLIVTQKDLQKATLDEYGMASIEAIQSQATKGKIDMLTFAGRLDPLEIESFAQPMY